jgi:hypothetical protein
MNDRQGKSMEVAGVRVTGHPEKKLDALASVVAAIVKEVPELQVLNHWVRR